MKNQVDFKKEWESTKKQLSELTKQVAVLAKKGEKEIVRFSKKSKLYLDTTAISLKQKDLYYLIGVEYVKSKKDPSKNKKLQGLLKEIASVNKDYKTLKTKMKKK